MRLKQKHVDASREARLWLGQIVIPAIATVMAVSPEAREWTRNKIVDVGKNIKSKFSKKES